MNRAEEILNNPHDVSESEANALASGILEEIECIETNVAVKSLILLGAHRTGGVSFSEAISKQISDWICSIYESQHDEEKDHIVELIMELKSSVAVTLVNNLLPLTQNEHLKNSLCDAAAYAGT